MKRFISVLTLLCVLAVSAFASADKQAKQLYDKGKLAEALQTSLPNQSAKATSHVEKNESWVRDWIERSRFRGGVAWALGRALA